MRKSREFDDALNECLERLLAQDETVEQCLNAYPEHAEALRPLLETALAAKEATAIQPRPEFRDRARYQLHSALRELEPKRSHSFFSWRWRPQWVTALATALAILLAGSGTVAAASGSMPDEPLYPVKLATERVQLTLTTSSLGKAELYAKLADRRVAEIVRMADESKPEKIALTAQRLNNHLTEMANLASAQEVVGIGGGTLVAPAEAPAAGQAPVAEEAPIVREAPAAEKAPAAKKAPSPKKALTAEKAPAPERAPEVREAPTVQVVPLPAEPAKDIHKVRVEATRRAKLKVEVARDAENNAEQLRAALEKAPEAAKPALLRAIADSQNGYEKAIKSLD